MVKSGHLRTVLLLSHSLNPAYIRSSINVYATLLFTHTLFASSVRFYLPSTLILDCMNTCLSGIDGAQVFVVALAVWPNLDTASIPLLQREDLLIVDKVGLVSNA